MTRSPFAGLVVALLLLAVSGCGAAVSTPSPGGAAGSVAAGSTPAAGVTAAPTDTAAAGGAGGAGATPVSPVGGASGGGEKAAAALVAAAKSACTVMPVDAVKAILPKAGPPSPEPEPFKCSMSDGNGVVEISIDATAFTALQTLNPCQPVSGVGVSACVQEQQKDDAFLQVLVNSGTPSVILYVEVAGHDGKSHLADAANIAKAILAPLG